VPAVGSIPERRRDPLVFRGEGGWAVPPDAPGVGASVVLGSNQCRALLSAACATGVLVGLFTWAIGLDMPFVWGVTSFLLNYIPMLGSIVAVIPPTLVAFLHPFSIIFWGWVWSIPGALMGIPLTAGLVIFCRKFEATEWFAQLLEKNPEKT